MILLGKHYLVEMSGCDSGLINNQAYVKNSMLDAAKLSGANIVADVFHQFNPQGLSGVVVIAESHFAIHTWPEHSCIAIDIFTCGPLMKLELAIKHLETAFKSKAVKTKIIDREIKK